VGYEEGGQLTEAVRRRPYSVVLLDEIEKAHGDVFNIFLQILDDGRVTDGQGRTVDFTNTVIIMTSNIGSREILSEKQPRKREEIVMQVLRNHFRPEFLNRIDDTVIFNSLDETQITEIVRIQTAKLAELLAAKELRFSISDEAVKYFSKTGYDPDYGARPLKRLIQKELQNVVAKKLLEGAFLPGDTVSVGLKGGSLYVEKNAASQ